MSWVTNRVEIRRNKERGRKEPMWKRRLRIRYKSLRTILEAVKSKETRDTRQWKKLEKKCDIMIKT